MRSCIVLALLAMVASCSTALAEEQEEQEEPLVYQGPKADKKDPPPRKAPKDKAHKPKSVRAEPVAAEPVAAEPVAAEPVAAEPVAAEPVAAEPVAAEPAADASLMKGTPRPLPERDDEIYPCMECHDDPEDFNTRVRNLRNAHEAIEIKHGGRERWCYDCHNQADKDKLRFASGAVTAFETSYLLCGQCHGKKLRDWYGGVHGKRVGFWNGEKTYSLCVNCHNPHQPRFKPLKPKPRPRRPSEIR